MCLYTLFSVVWKSPAEPLHSDHKVISLERSARTGRTANTRSKHKHLLGNFLSIQTITTLLGELLGFGPYHQEHMRSIPFSLQ